MSRRYRMAVVAVALALGACASGAPDRLVPHDNGPPFDWTETIISSPDTACANEYVEATESCVSDSLTNVCASCRWQTFCGDGEVAGSEVCDDGNQSNGDGCRADCAAPTCGDLHVDPEAGELCDDASCPSCMPPPSCGDGTRDVAEECDDGNDEDFDGCSRACRRTLAFVIDEFSFDADPTPDCVALGHTNPQNAVGQAMGPILTVLNQQLATDIETTPLALVFADWSVPTPAQSRLTITPVRVVDPTEPLIELALGPEWIVHGSVVDDAFVSTPAHVALALGALGPQRTLLDQFSVRLRVGASTEPPGRIAGHVCLALGGSFWALVPDRLPDGGRTPCVDVGRELTLADAVAGGRRIGVRATQPDIDMDGDGLGRFIVAGGPEDNCTPVIVGCVNGDGTVIDDPECIRTFGDGYSGVVSVNAMRASF